jgi:palmitoyltransferase ZDHHC9/14/18
MKFFIWNDQVRESFEINKTKKFFFIDITTSPQSVALPGRTIEVQMYTGHVIQLKFCTTCKIFRPPRVSHCSLCDACIGKSRNY